MGLVRNRGPISGPCGVDSAREVFFSFLPRVYAYGERLVHVGRENFCVMELDSMSTGKVRLKFQSVIHRPGLI